jgi:hypothetical protein
MAKPKARAKPNAKARAKPNAKAKAKPNAKTKAKPNAKAKVKATSERPAKILAKVTRSLEGLATSLGHDAWVSASNSGDLDRYVEEGDDIDSLYLDYWTHMYRPLFYGAYYALADDLRIAARPAAEQAIHLFFAGARDDNAAFKYMKRIKISWVSDKRHATLRFFDGTNERGLPSVKTTEIDKKLKRDRLS